MSLIFFSFSRKKVFQLFSAYKGPFHKTDLFPLSFFLQVILSSAHCLCCIAIAQLEQSGSAQMWLSASSSSIQMQLFSFWRTRLEEWKLHLQDHPQSMRTAGKYPCKFFIKIFIPTLLIQCFLISQLNKREKYLLLIFCLICLLALVI